MSSSTNTPNSSLVTASQHLALSLQSSLKQIPLEYRKPSFSHIPIVAKSLSEPQKKLQKLNQYIDVLQDAVDEITNLHARDFNQSIRNFSRSVDKVDESCQRVNQMIVDLERSETLLQSRAGELSQLYGSYLQHSECLRILKMIEEIRNVPSLLKDAIHTKHYLNAAENIIKYTDWLNRDELSGVKGLVDIRTEIDSFRRKLPRVLVQELNEFCYCTTTSAITSTHASQLDSNSSPHAAHSNVATHNDDANSSDLLLPELVQAAARADSSSSTVLASDAPVLDDDLSVNPQTDTSYFISMVIESLDRLNMLQDAQSSLIQDLKDNVRQLIESHILEFKDQFAESEQYWNLIHSHKSTSNAEKSKQQIEPLKRLLKQLFEKLIVVITNFKYVIQKMTHKLSSSQSVKSNHRRSFSSQLTREVLTKIKDSLRLKVNSLMTEQFTGAEKKKSTNMISILEELSKKLEDFHMVDGMFVKDIPEMFWNIAKAKLSHKTLHHEDSVLNSYRQDFNALLNEALTANPKLLTLSHLWNTIQLEVQSILVDLLHARISHTSDQDKKERKLNQKMEIRFKFGSNIDMTDHEAGGTGKKSSDSDSAAHGNDSLCKSLSDVFLFSPYNLIHIYKTIINFMNSVEEIDSSCKSGILVSYIEMEVIPDILIPRVSFDYSEKLSTVLDSSDSFQPNSSSKRVNFMVKDFSSARIRDHYSHLPLLQSVLSLNEWMDDLVLYSVSMPAHRRSFFNIIDMLLKRFYDQCKSKIESSLAGTYAMECLWTKTDVFNLLQSDPDWHKLNHIFTGGSALKFEAAEETFRKRLHDLVDAPLQQKQDIPKHLLISNATDTILLANMNMSLEWLSRQIDRVRQFKFEPRKGIRDPISPRHSKRKELESAQVDDMLSKLKSRRRRGAILQSRKHTKSFTPNTTSSANEDSLSPHSPREKREVSPLDKYVDKYMHLAHQTLFALKVDLRARCVIYLLPLRLSNYFPEEDPTEPESYIQNFNKDLKRFEECVELYMPRQKIFYLLHRLSTFIGHIFISSLPTCVQWRFNEKGVRKMQKNIQALQQNLINMIHAHSDTEEVIEQEAFSRAHKYYNMLLLTPKEIYDLYVQDVQSTREFSRQEYNAILETETHLHDRNQKYVRELSAFAESLQQ